MLQCLGVYVLNQTTLFPFLIPLFNIYVILVKLMNLPKPQLLPEENSFNN